MVDRWLDFIQALLPVRCVLCGAAGQPPDFDLCLDCEADLPVNRPACRGCGEALGSEPAGAVCGGCLRRPPRYDSATCPYRYEYPVDHLIRALKYDRAISHARVLGELLARKLRADRTTPWPDCLVPVPLGDERFRARGYNQALEIGRVLERALGIPMRADVLTRIRQTREQAALSAKERRQNVRNAFAIAIPLAERHVAILDDVATTGSTVNEIARVLRRGGVRSIEVWTVARATRDTPG